MMALLLYRIARIPRAGDRERMLTPKQETRILNMVMANNTIRLHEIQQQVIEYDRTFANINNVSISAISRLLERNKMCMKPIYRVLFERNSTLWICAGNQQYYSSVEYRSPYWYWPGSMSGLDTQCKVILSPLPCTWRHSMWCQWNLVVSKAYGCSVISFC